MKYVCKICGKIAVEDVVYAGVRPHSPHFMV